MTVASAPSGLSYVMPRSGFHDGICRRGSAHTWPPSDESVVGMDADAISARPCSIAVMSLGLFRLQCY